MGATSSVRRRFSTFESVGVNERKAFVSVHKQHPTVTSSKTAGYDIAFKVGEGGFSDVRAAYPKGNDEEKVCIKEIKLANYEKRFLNEVEYEFNILSQLSHPNIVQIYEVFAHKKSYFIVMELLHGGELFDAICLRERYTESDARDVMKTALEALTYCHKLNVMHRDIKPENFILVNKTFNSPIKLIDFGFARVLKEGEKLSDLRGSAMYLSPEMIAGSYGLATDVWSLGVVFYILLSGNYPFECKSSDLEEIKGKICQGHYEFPPQYWGDVSAGAIDLICKMLTVDPEKRISMKDALDHPWMNSNVEGEGEVEIDLANTKEAMRKFQIQKRMKAAGLAVRATTILSNNAKFASKFKKNK